MKHASLAAHYRPQTFAEVTGQDMITTVLSRAAAEDRVAAAYLLSGTRGVGKTTIARILAKALNCVHAPTAEPCNQCANCQMITKGNHVDVTEIDGASNNSVEDARALRENIGYAPMEGRYKVFIIDEAHMLSRSAFNALLKTLEEPPPRVVFIFATTEVHKFPITIVSRCQHFIFKRLSEDGLVAHLSRVLTKEEITFDPQAVRTIARRANGSVRDSMSLLGQTLALGESTLSMDSTRAVLGLAGQELFTTLLEAIAREDCPAVMELMHKLSDQGIDIGFFLHELIGLWRTLFLLREAGEGIIPSLGLTQEESELWLAVAAQFSAAHLHAAWHMTLDTQRKIIHSPEPAAALELLLINLALMPRLLPLQAAPLPRAEQDAGHAAAQASDRARPAQEAEKKNSPHLESSPESRLDSRLDSGQQPPHANISTSAQGSRALQSHASFSKEISEPKPSVTCAQSGASEVSKFNNQTYTQQTAEHASKSMAEDKVFEKTAPATQAPQEPLSNTPSPQAPSSQEWHPALEDVPAMLFDEPNTGLSYEEAFAQEPFMAEPVFAEPMAREPMVAKPVAAKPVAAKPVADKRPSFHAQDQTTVQKAAEQQTTNSSFTKPARQPSWEEIVAHNAAQEPSIVSRIFLQQAHGSFINETLHIQTKSMAVYDAIERARTPLQEALQNICHYGVQIQVHKPKKTFKPEASLVEEFSARAELKDCLEILDASIYKVRPLNEI